MIDSIRTVDNDVYRLRSEINTLRERIIVTEIQLNVLIEDYKDKKEFWAKIRNDLKMIFVWMVGMAIILIAKKFHLIS